MEWISVEDELPPADIEQIYFVLTKDEFCEDYPSTSLWMTGGVWVETWEPCEPYWLIEDGGKDGKVTHWMPIPELKKPD